jgi:CTP:molybdopterin cytidylyltransferase MocA
MGTPKALVDDPAGGSFVERGVRVLRAGGCSPVVVVVGAESQRSATLATAAGADLVVDAPDWSQGQSASLRAGLMALQSAEVEVEVACILLVDLPDVGAAVVERVLTAALGDGRGAGAGAAPARAALARAALARAALARAAYQGGPGHPGVLGRDHWQGVLDRTSGDRGARDYLATHDHLLVECGDLATGRDVDTPADL